MKKDEALLKTEDRSTGHTQKCKEEGWMESVTAQQGVAQDRWERSIA